MTERRAEHRRLPALEDELKFFESLLAPVEQSLVAEVEPSDEPVCFIMGCARSGTTVVHQYLAASGIFGYPTNFVSRFYFAPYIGVRLQRMLHDFDVRNEIFPAASSSDRFASNLGKTHGAAAPHEFWYFWRRFFHFGDVQKLTEEELTAVDGSGFRRELSAFQSVSGRPLVMKGMILNWHVPYLADLLPNAFFVHVERDELSNAQSLLRARQDFFADSNAWYSFKPPGYEATLSLPPEVQTLWQVRETNRAVEDGLNEIEPERSLTVSYEDFCVGPESVFADIARMMDVATVPVDKLPGKFDFRNKQSDLSWESAVRHLSDG